MKSWSDLNAIGRQEAELLIPRLHLNPLLLGGRVRRMIHTGCYGGIEAGFLLRIAQGCVAQSGIDQEINQCPRCHERRRLPAAPHPIRGGK